MKVLCICQNGNNRSVFMAYRLKRFGHEALAAGWNKLSEQTLHMLCDWADKIIIMEGQFYGHIPLPYRNKVIAADVGPDEWGPQWHSELRKRVYAAYDRLQQQGEL